MTGQFYNHVLSQINKRTDESKSKETVLRENVSLLLKAYRAEKDLSQDGLALKLGITRRQLIRWENMECTPSQLALSRMHSIGIRLPEGYLKGG